MHYSIYDWKLYTLHNFLLKIQNCLNFLLQYNGESDILFSKTGDRGNHWLIGNVDVNKDSPYRLAFTGTVGPGEKGDVAIDDIMHIPGSCDAEGEWWWRVVLPNKQPEFGGKTAQCVYEEPNG